MVGIDINKQGLGFFDLINGENVNYDEKFKYS